MNAYYPRPAYSLTAMQNKGMLSGMARHVLLIDYLRRHLPSDSFIRPYAKRIVEDGRTLLRTPRKWDHLEIETPKTLFVETTNICNADCIFCAYQYQAGFRPGKGVMKPGHKYKIEATETGDTEAPLSFTVHEVK